MRFVPLLIMAFLVGCAGAPRSRLASVPAPVPVPQVPQPPKEQYKPLWSATGVGFAQLDSERGLTHFMADRIIGHTKDGQEIVIYDEATEGAVDSRVLAGRLRKFQDEHDPR